MDFLLLCPCHFRTPKAETNSIQNNKKASHLQITRNPAAWGMYGWILTVSRTARLGLGSVPAFLLLSKAGTSRALMFVLHGKIAWLYQDKN